MNMRSISELLKIRRASVNQARVVLANALAAEQAAAAEEIAANSMIREQVTAAADLSAGDAVVEALAAWLPHARSRQLASRDLCRLAEAAMLRARAEFAAARAAEALIEGFVAAGKAAELTAAERRAMAALNEDTLSKRVNDFEAAGFGI